MTNILLSGAGGKMGAAVARISEEHSETKIIAGIDSRPVNAAFPVYGSFSEISEKSDVIVDFSHPSVLPELLGYARMTRTPAVICTTGFSSEEIETIKKTSEEAPVFFTFNMSLGINLLADLARRAAEVLGGSFDIEIVEKHHNQKQDAPSGTAIMLAEAIEEKLPYSPHYIYSRQNVRRTRGKTEIGFHSIRGGTVVGEHDVIFAGHDEVITLSHSAGSKEVFAAGAVNSALFLAGKKGGNGLYDMKSLLNQ